MASTVVDLTNARAEERASEAVAHAGAPATLPAGKAGADVARLPENPILATTMIMQSLVPALGALMKAVAIPAIVLTFVIFNFKPLSKVIDALPAVASRISSIEAAGFKAELKSVDRVALTLPRHVSDV